MLSHDPNCGVFLLKYMTVGYRMPRIFVCTGFLGFGQKAGAEEALPFRQLAHLLHQVSFTLCVFFFLIEGRPSVLV